MAYIGQIHTFQKCIQNRPRMIRSQEKQLFEFWVCFGLISFWRRPSIFKNFDYFLHFWQLPKISKMWTGVSNLIFVKIFVKIFGIFGNSFAKVSEFGSTVYFWSSFDFRNFRTFDFCEIPKFPSSKTFCFAFWSQSYNKFNKS